jgi:hypothetical protein
MTARPLTSREVRERRGQVLDERDALAALFEPPFTGFSTLIGRTYGPVLEKPMALDADTGVPAIADGAVTSAAAEYEPVTQQLDLQTHQPKPRGLKT